MEIREDPILFNKYNFFFLVLFVLPLGIGAPKKQRLVLEKQNKPKILAHFPYHASISIFLYKVLLLCKL